MSCFMGYNPLVAKEVKITTWIKEFDGESPVYPSFPNDGDCFVVFATDEDALTHNALSKKTYTNGDWADAEGGGGGDSDFTTATVTFNMSAGNVHVFCPYYDEDWLGGHIRLGDGESVDVLVYKEGTIIYLDRNVVSVTGDIEDDGDIDIGSELNPFTMYSCFVMGDGTITLS